MSINPLNDISKVYLEQVATQEVNIEEGMTLKDYKKKKSALKQKEKRAADKIAPGRRAGIHADKASPERAARHRANVDPDFEGNDERNYPGGKLKNPKKIRKAKALGELGESAVPGKPAERLGAVTAISKSEQDAARERILAKTKAKREAMKEERDDEPGEGTRQKYGDMRGLDRSGAPTSFGGKWQSDERKKSGTAALSKLRKEALDPVGQEDADIDNDGDTDKSDKYLHKRRKAIGKAIAKKNVKEGYSNWRQELIEVMDDEIDSKPIKEKKVNNKIKINPELKETVEEIGGTLLEMVEIDEVDFIVESVYGELLEEGYEEDDIEEAIEYALVEAKVTYGHDTSTPPQKKTGAGQMVKAVGRLARQKLAKKVGDVKKSAKAAVARGARKVAKGALGIARKMEGGTEAPKTVARKPSTYRGAGAGTKEKVSSGSYTPPSKKKAEKPADPWEGSASTPPKAKAKPAPKKAAAPKAKAPAAPKRKRKSKLDDLLASVRSESVIGNRSRNAVADDRLDAEQEKTNTSMNKLRQQNKRFDRALASDAARKVERDVKKSSSYGPQRPKPGTVTGRRIEDPKPTGSKATGYRVEELQINEMPYQVMGSPDGGKEKKIGKPVKSKKYADARAAELADTHKATGGKYRSQYVEEVEQIDELSVNKMLAYKKKAEKNRDELNKKWDKGTATYREKMRVLGREEGEARASRRIEKKTGKHPLDMNKLDKLKAAVTKEETQIDEKTLSKMEMKKREEIVKSMKDKASDFEKRYPGRGKEVMYATATKMAKKMAEQVLPTEAPSSGSTLDKKKEMLDKQKFSNMKMLQQKERQLQNQKMMMKKSGKLPLEAD